MPDRVHAPTWLPCLVLQRPIRHMQLVCLNILTDHIHGEDFTPGKVRESSSRSLFDITVIITVSYVHLKKYK